MAVQRLSSKNQIVIPREARLAMGVKPGDELLVVVKGNITLVISKPKAYGPTLQGLAEGTYPSGYLKRERPSGSWNMRKKRSGSSAQGKRVGAKAQPTPDSQIDFSDIPEATDAQLGRMRRVGRSSSGRK